MNIMMNNLTRVSILFMQNKIDILKCQPLKRKSEESSKNILTLECFKFPKNFGKELLKVKTLQNSFGRSFQQISRKLRFIQKIFFF